MGYSGKHHHQHQVGGSGTELEERRWVIAGIQLRAPLKQIYTKPVVEAEREEEEDCPVSVTTPTGEESRIPARLACPPPPPRKRKAALKCNYGAREFFTPPDLETVFLSHTCSNCPI